MFCTSNLRVIYLTLDDCFFLMLFILQVASGIQPGAECTSTCSTYTHIPHTSAQMYQGFMLPSSSPAATHRYPYKHTHGVISLDYGWWRPLLGNYSACHSLQLSPAISHVIKSWPWSDKNPNTHLNSRCFLMTNKSWRVALHSGEERLNRAHDHRILGE